MYDSPKQDYDEQKVGHWSPGESAPSFSTQYGWGAGRRNSTPQLPRQASTLFPSEPIRRWYTKKALKMR